MEKSLALTLEFYLTLRRGKNLYSLWQGYLEKYLGKGKVREIIESLTLDRGYWGAHFLWELKHKWGTDFITLVRDDDLDFVKHVEYYLRGVKPVFKERWITVTRREKKKITELIKKPKQE